MNRFLLTHRGKLTMVFVVVVAAFVLVLPAMAYAKTLYVSTTGNDANSGLLGHPVATVQKAVDLAIAGDVVEVGAGTFSGDVTMTDRVSLSGAGPAQTTLTASASSIVVTANGIGASTSISGFTISGSRGDGIYCGNSSPSITNDTISGNSYDGIECWNSSSPSITNDTISGNSYDGIYCNMSSSPSITNDTISGNSHDGIDCWNSSSPSITNDTISGNSWNGIDCDNSSSPSITNDTISGKSRDGIYCNMSSSPSITNDTISGNSWYGIYCESASSPRITNCIVWDDSSADLHGCSATYSDVSVGGGGNGDISTAPSFVDTATSDFHLRAGSPCIDKGTSVGAPATDKDGIPRPQGSGYDMGAYEFSTYRLHYAATTGGSIEGSATQVVAYDTSGTPVTATPSAYYDFVSWSDASTANPRTDGGVTADATYTANFTRNPALATTTKLKAPTSAKKGKTLKLTGTVTPSAAWGTVKLYLYRLVGKKWKSAGTPTATLKTGGFTYSFKPKYRGKWRFRAHYLGVATYCVASWNSGYANTTVK